MIKFDFPTVGQVPSLVLLLRTSMTVDLNINVYFTLCLANDYCIIVTIINTKSHYEVTISPEKKYFTERKRALCYIYPCTLCVELTVRVGAKLRC